MSRRTWSKGTFHITYGNPSIQGFKGDFQLLKDKSDIMYFYYDIDILDGKKILFSASTHDFPKVQNLPTYIDYIINMKESDMFLYEDLQSNGFHRKKLYNFITLDDDFDMDCEYFYKIERMITYVKQSYENEFKRHEEYTLTIGKNEINKKGYSNGEDFGRTIFIKYLTKDDLLRLKNTAEEFVKEAIRVQNEVNYNYKIKCPYCDKHFKVGEISLNKLDKKGYEMFKCNSCNKEFTDNDKMWIH